MFLFYILATSIVISGRVLTCDSVHSLLLYSVVPLGDQATSRRDLLTATVLWVWAENGKYCTQSRTWTYTSCHSRASILTITLPRLPDANTLSAPTCVCDFMLERSGRTSTILCIGLIVCQWCTLLQFRHAIHTNIAKQCHVRSNKGLEHRKTWAVRRRSCLLLFYSLETFTVILRWVISRPTCDSAHSWRFFSAAPLRGDQAAINMTRYLTLSWHWAHKSLSYANNAKRLVKK